MFGSPNLLTLLESEPWTPSLNIQISPKPEDKPSKAAMRVIASLLLVFKWAPESRFSKSQDSFAKL